MLSKVGNNDLRLITELVKQFWHSNVQIGDVEILEAPFDMFNIYMIVYGNMEICITYDRSLVNLEVKQGNEYINIRNIIKEGFINGFASSENEPFLHNLRILDTYLCSLKGKKAL